MLSPFAQWCNWKSSTNNLLKLSSASWHNSLTLTTTFAFPPSSFINIFRKRLFTPSCTVSLAVGQSRLIILHYLFKSFSYLKVCFSTCISVLFLIYLFEIFSLDCFRCNTAPILAVWFCEWEGCKSKWFLIWLIYSTDVAQP